MNNREKGRAAQRIYDRRRIERLRVSLGSAAIVDDLIDLFIAELPQHVDAVCEAARDGDGEAIAFAAHRLRSGSGNFGARRLDTICEQLENLGHAGAIAEARAALDRLREETDLIIAALSTEKLGARKN